MVSPATYTGFDKDNNQIGSQTAQDANSYIDPAKVQAAIDKVNKTVQEQMKNISSALKGIVNDANDAVVVQGTKMGPTIETLCGTIDSIPGSISGNIGQMYQAAVNAHDKIQTELNEQAEASVRSLPDFDHLG